MKIKHPARVNTSAYNLNFCTEYVTNECQLTKANELKNAHIFTTLEMSTVFSIMQSDHYKFDTYSYLRVHDSKYFLND